MATLAWLIRQRFLGSFCNLFFSAILPFILKTRASFLLRLSIFIVMTFVVLLQVPIPEDSQLTWRGKLSFITIFFTLLLDMFLIVIWN